MSTASQLDVIQEEAEKLVKLLKDRHPGLATWNEVLHARLTWLQHAMHDLYEPDGYENDDCVASSLADLLDEADAGSIHEVTPYWKGEKQFAVVHYDKDGLSDHQTFKTKRDAEAFLATLGAP